MGFPIYYADIEAKKLMNNHPLIQKSLIGLFGSDIYFKGELNKDKLAGHIFQDENARLLVNQLVHPLVREAFSIWSSKQNSSLVFWSSRWDQKDRDEFSNGSRVAGTRTRGG